MNNKIKIRLYRSTRNATPTCLSTHLFSNSNLKMQTYLNSYKLKQSPKRQFQIALVCKRK